MDYGEVLTRAWRIVWKYKILWLFGILAGLGSAAGNSGGGSGNTGIRQSFNFNTPSGTNEFVFRMQQFFQNIPVWVWILLILASLVLFVVLVVLSTVGQIGLVRGASEGDEDVAHLSFGPLFTSSLGYFWRVFLLNLLVGLAVLIVVTVITVGIIVLGVTTLGFALICLIPLLCILIPVMIVVGWLISVVLQQSVVAIVVENRGIIEGLERGWEVVRGNIGAFILMALILFIGGGIAAFIIALPMTFILVPLVIGLAGGARNATLIGVGVSALLFLIYLPFLLLLNGVLRAYIVTAWTLTFRRLTHPQVAAPAPASAGPLGPASPLEPGGPVEPASPTDL